MIFNFPIIKILLSVSIFFSGTWAVFSQTSDNNPDDIWKIICAEDNPKFCLMQANLVSNKGQDIAKIVIGVAKVNNGKVWYINTFLPLGLSIPAGVSFRVDESKPIKLNLQRCDPDSCRANTVLNNELIARMKQGNMIQLIFVDDRSEKNLGLNFTLIGFTKVFDALSARVL